MYDDFTSATASQTGLTGNTLAIRFIANSDSPQEYYFVDDIAVVGTPITVGALSISSTNPSCVNSSNGTITISTGLPLGIGSTTITYIWSTGSTAASLSGLAAGTYTVTATIGGNSRVMSKTLIAPARIEIAATPTHPTSGSNGSIALVVTGGSSPYTYLWSSGATTKNIASLAAGIYTVTVTDASSCTTSASSTINPPSGPCTCIANGNWTNPAIWSGNCTGGNGSYGGQGDTVIINGYQVTIDSTHTAKSIVMSESASGVSRFTYTGANTLTVLGDVTLTTTGTGGNVELEIEGSATMHILGSMVINHSKGNNVTIKLNSSTGNDAKLQIDGNLSMTMSTGSGDLFIYSYAANDTILVGGNVLFYNNNTSSTADMIITQNSSSKFIVGGDIKFDGARNQNMELILNNSSELQLGGSITRQASPKKFGKITMNSSSSLVFNGSATQFLDATTGNTDNNIYKTIIVRNTSPISPQIVLSGDVTVTGTLTMQDGNIGTGSNMLILSSNSASALSALSGHSANSYVVGTIRRYITANAATYEFPLGYGGANEYYCAKITNNYMIGPSYLTATFGELAIDEKHQPISVSDGGELYTSINPAGIWTIDPNTQPLLGSYSIEVNTNNFSGLVDGQYRLIKRPTKSGKQSWGNGGVPKGLLNHLDLILTSGKTTLSGLTSFSDFGMGESGGGSLPIDLVSFDAEVDATRVRLDWVVSMEINNDYFTIERSLDGLEFEPIATVKGAGSHSTEKQYQAFDETPEMGLSYYRLRQTDFDGMYKVYDMVSVMMTSASANTATTSFDIVPNPNKGSFTLRLDTPFDQTKVMVMSYVGQIVFVSDMVNTSGKTQTPLDLGSNVAAGIYIVKVDTGKDTYIRQMVVE